MSSVSNADGKQAIGGKWFVKDVETPVEVNFDGKEATAKLGRVDFVGKPRDGSNFEMDVQLGGFPLIAEMKEKDSQKLLQFSNGGMWSKDAPLKSAPAPAAAGAKGGIPMSEVQKHKSKDSAWVVIDNQVYDLTAFLEDHPGGPEVVLKWAGKDATKFWSAIHKKEWIKEYTKPEWQLGPVGPEPVGAASEELKKAEDEIKNLKLEIERLRSAPTKPSAGLQQAMGAAAAGVQASKEVAKVDSPPVQEAPEKLKLKGRRVLVIGHGPVAHDFLLKTVGAVGPGALEITCVGEEPRLAYDRVHLTEYFVHRDASKLSMCDAQWGIDQKVTLRKSVRATKIDREKQIVTMKDVTTGKTDEVAYDALVLSTGSYPFVPPIKNLSKETVGVFVYRDIEDLESMILFAKKSKRAAVIGGGLLGLEAAKAVYDLGQESHVLEMAPYLMPTQLEEGGGKVLAEKIGQMDIKVHLSSRLNSVVVENGVFKGMMMTDAENKDEYFLELDMLVVSAGIRPRDELARDCGLAVGQRGGVVVNDRMQSSDPNIYALGEVACHKGLCYGLIAPGWDQATVLAKNFEDATWGLRGKSGSPPPEPPLYNGSDLSTKLKLLGVDVASFGSSLDFWFKRQFDDAKAKEQGLTSTLQVDPFSGLYRKLTFDQNQKLMGGLLVGNADDYFSLLGLAQQDDLGKKSPVDLFMGGGAGGDDDVNDLKDDAIVCLCQKVTKKQIIDAVKEEDCSTIADLKKVTTAGAGCGGCLLATGFVPKLLKNALEECGKKLFTGISPAIPFSRRELFEIIKVKKLKTWEEVIQECGRQGKIPDLQTSMAGDEVCKPAVASILASLWQENPTKDGLHVLQDTNDQFLGNMQRSGQYSVIPRVPGGELTPDELILMGTVAKKFDLWTKVTGAQRIGLFGANVWQLPAIWEDLVYGRSSVKTADGKVMVKVETQGMESGHAYAKALRAVKTCVGTSWCRFGQQDSVGMGNMLEQRYKGLRMPHKFKMGVSGCMRECAEAQGKDIGLVATTKGYNLYVCGNHGTSPKHATLFLTDVSDDECVKYIDRVLAYYTFTADPLTRTSKWLENLEGGIEHLREVCVEDKLGICEELDAHMQTQVDTFECEWKRVVDSPDLRAKFKQFANVDDVKYGDLEWSQQRNQKKIQVEDMPAVVGPAKISKASADATWRWVDCGPVANYKKGGGAAVKISKSELAVWHHLGTDKWYAAQNSCPHKQLQVLSRGLVGFHGDVPKVACPIHKNTYNLDTGKGISNPGYNLSTFNVKEEGGKIFVQVPPDDVLDKALAREDPKGNCGGACEAPKDLQW